MARPQNQAALKIVFYPSLLPLHISLFGHLLLHQKTGPYHWARETDIAWESLSSSALNIRKVSILMFEYVHASSHPSLFAWLLARQVSETSPW